MINLISSSRYRLDRKSIRNTTQYILSQNGFSPEYLVNIVFVGKIKMKQLARKYKQEDEVLPVLTFSYLEEYKGGENLLGEIFICYPQAVLLAAHREKKVDDTIVKLIDHGIKNLLKEHA